jgi:hypothetical protein
VTAFQKGDDVFATYAYDGSGVAIRAKATVQKVWYGKARIKLAAHDAEGIEGFGSIVPIVDTAKLSDLGSYPAVASFGWLD